MDTAQHSTFFASHYFAGLPALQGPATVVQQQATKGTYFGRYFAGCRLFGKGVKIAQTPTPKPISRGYFGRYFGG